ncbi:MAG TPA: ORF6N domain-containing protein [Kiritimatiellia bacterium]|nr:ORF6N domain-containing protein [Kiritimatiellia bacterium]HRZ12381.1 ORF6N domain-containing protein [Kiritimatiellia bacterium]HSA17861.1 ORF6N domain-containing protein [Kiritimatiellia bacterium]
MIYLLRGQRVMLDSDLATLYGVKTKELNKAVSRNRDRFPADFVFPLAREEVARLRFQIGTSNEGRGGRRYRPYAFTEEGVAMLSGVLRSERAVHVNVAIMRAFVRLRGLLAAHHELAAKLTELERRVASNEEGIQTLFEAIRQLMSPPEPTRKQIGFSVREKRAHYGRK